MLHGKHLDQNKECFMCNTKKVIYLDLMKNFTSKTQRIGELGEELACKYLLNKGYSVVDRNFTTKVGEIDIVAKNDSDLFFIEVKSANVSHVTNGANLYISPEENFHKYKLAKFMKTVEIYCLERNVSRETIKIMLLAVYINIETLKSKIMEYPI